MNREEAAYIIELGREAIEKLGNIPGSAVYFHPEVVTKPEWYELVEGE